MSKRLIEIHSYEFRNTIYSLSCSSCFLVFCDHWAHSGISINSMWITDGTYVPMSSKLSGPSTKMTLGLILILWAYSQGSFLKEPVYRNSYQFRNTIQDLTAMVLYSNSCTKVPNKPCSFSSVSLMSTSKYSVCKDTPLNLAIWLITTWHSSSFRLDSNHLADFGRSLKQKTPNEDSTLPACAGWSESSLFTWRYFVSSAMQNAPIEDSYQTMQMRIETGDNGIHHKITCIYAYVSRSWSLPFVMLTRYISSSRKHTYIILTPLNPTFIL